MISKRYFVSLAAFSLAVSTPFLARADVRLHGLFTDNMVLQQGAPIRIWGWADADETVTVDVAGYMANIKSSGAGKWMISVPARKAGGPISINVKGKNTITLTNVMVGEVWIASGQSNMEWPMRATFDAENEIAKTANPMLRLFTVQKLRADAPVDDVTNSWAECSPQTVPGFSAVGYYFGRDLQKALNVPVGVIHTSWGGSPAEVWMSERVLSANRDYQREILDAYPAARQRFLDSLAQFQKDEAEAKNAGQPFNKRRPNAPWKPTELYNGMIAPLIPFPIKGAIWYQGESNAGRAHQYRTLFADMIKNWRRDWGLGDFTFLEVQLAPFMAIRDQPTNSTWAELREAQLLATQTLPKVGMAVITDVGEEKDIHPKKKEPVGARLALAARAIAYGEKIVYSGPVYKSVKFKDGKAIVSFDHVGGGLEAHGTRLTEQAHNAGVTHAGFSPDGKQIITENSGGVVRVWDTKTGKPLQASGAGSAHASSSEVKIWDAATGKLVQSLRGFALAGADQKFIWANAIIEGDKVVVSSPEVPKPVAVRFGWADYPVVNLWNKDGLPATPFRTDDWPMITAPKKETAKK